MSFGSQTTANTASVSPREKLSRMAEQLASRQLAAYYIPPEDEHLNEYLPEYKKRIQWLTGFSGESAPLLVTPERMHLYVDGRFHLQVDQEVDPGVVEAVKMNQDQAAASEKLIAETLKKLSRSRSQADQPLQVGYDPFQVMPSRLKALQDNLADTPAIKLVPVQGNLVDPAWTDRPPMPSDPAFAVNETLTGEGVSAKLRRIREEMAKNQAVLLPITRLDDIAWLYNIRGRDIPYNPVLEAYAILTPEEAHLFAPPGKIPADIKQSLASEGVTLHPYAEYPVILDKLLGQSKNPRVWVDKSSLTVGTRDIIDRHTDQRVEKPNPVTMQKALKNLTEIDRMLQANFQASRAIIRHLAWVDKAFAQGQRLSETQVRDHLEAMYREEPNFFDLSFPTIPGIAGNSAIIHYSHADPKQVGQDGDFYLLDSGSHYTGGTTDTTRTTVFGTPRRDQIEKYTLVLKAHINCANFRFPEGTSGAYIDSTARRSLYQQGLDYGHGTGHGVGAFLNVHEGPNRISKLNNTPFKPGMVTSIEPGYYEKDWGGIRLENLYYVAEDTSLKPFQGKKWLRFEPLTFVPFEKKLIDFAMLNDEELAWLKTYNKRVWDKLSPVLNDEERAWLKTQCTIPRRRTLYDGFKSLFTTVRGQK